MLWFSSIGFGDWAQSYRKRKLKMWEKNEDEIVLFDLFTKVLNDMIARSSSFKLDITLRYVMRVLNSQMLWTPFSIQFHPFFNSIVILISGLKKWDTKSYSKMCANCPENTIFMSWPHFSSPPLLPTLHARDR